MTSPTIREKVREIIARAIWQGITAPNPDMLDDLWDAMNPARREAFLSVADDFVLSALADEGMVIVPRERDDWLIDTEEGRQTMERRFAAYHAACLQIGMGGTECHPDERGTCAKCADMGDAVLEAHFASHLSGLKTKAGGE